MSLLFYLCLLLEIATESSLFSAAASSMMQKAHRTVHRDSSVSSWILTLNITSLGASSLTTSISLQIIYRITPCFIYVCIFSD